MKKSLLATLLALIMVVSCLPSAGVAEEWEPVTLKMWVAGEKQKDSDKVWAAVNEKLQEYLPNTTLEITAIPFSEYYEKWSKSMAAGEQIDLAWYGWVHNISTEVGMGSLLPLDDLIEQYGQDMAASLGQVALEAHRHEGSIYVIPCWQGLLGGKFGTYFPKELVESCGNPQFVEEFEKIVQETYKDYSVESLEKLYDKLEEYCAGLKNAGKINLGVQNNITAPAGVFGQTLIPFGYERMLYMEWGDDTFTVQSEYLTESKAYEIALYNAKRNHDFYEKGYWRSDIVSSGWPSNPAPGKDLADCAILCSANYWFNDELFTQEEIDASVKQSFGHDMLVAESAPNGFLGTGYATGTCIPYTSKNPERAMMLINLLNSPKGADLYQLLVYGIEGQHYTIDDAGEIVYANANPTGADSTYGLSNWATGTCLNSLGASNVKFYNNQAAMEKTAVMNPLASFTFDPANVEVQWANCTAVVVEYLWAFVEDNYEELMLERNEKMAAAGIQDVVDELQRQVNDFLKINNYEKWPEH